MWGLVFNHGRVSGGSRPLPTPPLRYSGSHSTALGSKTYDVIGCKSKFMGFGIGGAATIKIKITLV